ncbi:hypothetical protein Poli38472_006253 [Pythium oligandrum]|uniref:TsaA-like domain-containing protein n=1 Tax=Pythium oligandrum TaxID=41045 RepID=A0A8K1CSJ8_PYTOL|nr:hypothetical protein Poli38472_006253 [Pythium oligandrum]|eukprot:TMW68785.1 hypothetical protein Poli38472_006253 [Pythium oligandrum]
MMTRDVVWLVVLAAQTSALWWLWRARRQEDKAHEDLELLGTLKQRAAELENEVARKEGMRVEERRGRVSAEKELRRVMDEKLDTSNGHYVQALGHVHSCFKSCLGTPRQGLFAPSTRGLVTFHRNVSPDTLIGLEAFTHLWIVFVFHKNTNGKNARAHQGLRSDSHRYTFKAKIAPPKLKERVGIFSTRSPHRPNPIGITLAKIESVDCATRTVHLSGLDLVDGTPVLDIKPYVPAYDAVLDARAASWVSLDLSPTINQVRWTSPDTRAVLECCAETSRLYRGDAAALQAAIEEVLQVDVRSKEQTARRQRDNNTLVLDCVRVSYRLVEQVASVIDVHHIEAIPSHL